MAIGKSKLHEMLRRARRISDLDAWVSAWSDLNFREQILDLIRDEQIFRDSITGDGSAIGQFAHSYGRFYPAYYGKHQGFSKNMGEPYQLNWSGFFFNTFSLTPTNESIIIDADGTTNKDTDIVELYGPNLLMLTNENMTVLQRKVKNKYIEYIRKILLQP